MSSHQKEKNYQTPIWKKAFLNNPNFSKWWVKDSDRDLVIQWNTENFIPELQGILAEKRTDKGLRLWWTERNKNDEFNSTDDDDTDEDECD